MPLPFLPLLVFANCHRDLQGRCGLLIAANALANAIYMNSYLVQLAIVQGVAKALEAGHWEEAQGIPLRRCFPLVCVPLFFMACSYVLFPAIAFDRLIGVLFPLWSGWKDPFLDFIIFF